MCGVFGYQGIFRSDLSNFLLDGLKKLEYRGYDSSGIAVLNAGRIKLVKEVGKLANLRRKIGNNVYGGSLGIGHTRWATHGGVTVKNSHPHPDCSGQIAVVHNGIIENFETLKKDLIKKGHKFVSETDTEVFSHLVEEIAKKEKDFKKAVRLAFGKLTGLNAVVALSTNGEMVAFRKGSPLVAGITKDAGYISSDIPTLSSVADKIVLLKEGQGVWLKSGVVHLISEKSGKITKPKGEVLKMEGAESTKGNYKHFILKEIYEQPEVLMRVSANQEKGIHEVARMIKNAKGTYFTACGTASYAGLYATYAFATIAKTHVNFSVASEFPYLENFLEPRSLLIVASQSGETMDTLEAVRAAKRHGSKVLALVNVPGSSLTRVSDVTLLLKAGPERAVLSTKSYIAKLGVFSLLAYTLDGNYEKGKNVVREASIGMSKMFSSGIEKRAEELARKIVNKSDIYLIGRGESFATALEGALKIKESSYIHAEGFAGGELKHGTIALIEKGTPVIVIAPNDNTKNSILSNAMELKSRGAYIIGVSPTNDPVFDFYLPIQDTSLSSILSIVPLQLLAYHLTLLKGHDPDMPRNLAKSVTVK